MWSEGHWEEPSAAQAHVQDTLWTSVSLLRVGLHWWEK